LGVLGSTEVDFRFSVIQRVVGFRHFTNGISKLKMTSGREHKDIIRRVVCVIYGAEPSAVVRCVRSFCDFYYRSQDDWLDDDDKGLLKEVLSEFHSLKDIFIEEGLRTDWKIPKLEQLHSLVLSVPQMGAPRQFSTDRTEHAHIEAAKEPWRASNHKNVNPQICRWLDRLEKRRFFDLSVAIQRSGVDLRQEIPTASAHSPLVPATRNCLADIKTVELLTGPARDNTDYFARAKHIQQLIRDGALPQKRLTRLRTFCTEITAYHLNCDPDIVRITIDEAAARFQLPDLPRAIREFYGNQQQPHDRSGPVLGVPAWFNDDPLPFETINIWVSLKVQLVNTKRPGCDTARTVCAAPPSAEWKLGRYDSCLFINHSCPPWTGTADLKGESHSHHSNQYDQTCLTIIIY
jgi:hypothetical protein